MNYTTQITVAIINLWSTKKWLTNLTKQHCKKHIFVADASFHIQGDDIMFVFWPSIITFGNIFQLIEKQGYQIY